MGLEPNVSSADGLTANSDKTSTSTNILGFDIFPICFQTGVGGLGIEFSVLLSIEMMKHYPHSSEYHIILLTRHVSFKSPT